jgi:hypothetical protein
VTSCLWTICIPTLASRHDKLKGLLEILLPQAEPHAVVEVVGLHNNGELPLSRYRDELLTDARGRYVSFVDDDDLVAPDFVDSILRAMLKSAPDIVTFNYNYYGSRECVQFTGNLDYGCWHDTAYTRCRDVTHLFPARTTLARQCSFGPDSSNGEDVHYADMLRLLLRTQERIGRVLYHYRYNPADSSQASLPPHTWEPRLEVSSPAFRWTCIEEAA